MFDDVFACIFRTSVVYPCPFLVLFLNFYRMRKIFSCWEKWQNSRVYHWLRADETYLSQFQKEPELFRQKALTGAERWAVIRCISLVLLLFLLSCLLLNVADVAVGFFFWLQAMILSAAFVLAIGAVGVAVTEKPCVTIFCWCTLGVCLILLAQLFEQMYTLSILGCIVVGHVLCGACMGMVLGCGIVLLMVKDTKAYLKRIGIWS